MTVRSKAIVFLSIAALIILIAETATFGQNRSGRAHPRKKNGGAMQALVSTSSARIFAVRLKPGQDLREELEKLTKSANIRAGFILTAVGSLKKAALRLADRTEASTFEQKFEIVSLVGTLSTDGVHLHVSLSDQDGKTTGGHLVSGCIVYTTAEIVIGEARDLIFTRELDEQTGYKELRIHKKAAPHRR
jgi:predicted DNA-binding protein with PD1-like motif